MLSQFIQQSPLIQKPETMDSPSVLRLFDEIADSLLNRYLLKIANKDYRLTEIEFYYHSTYHPDNSVHKNEGQLAFGKWYFHRMKNGISFKGGNYKGLDIAFGDESKNIHFGILIRGLSGLADNREIYGSGTVAKFIETETNQSQEVLDSQDVFTYPNLCLVAHSFEQQAVYNCPRVRLGQDTQPEYQKAYYRYFIFPQKEHDLKEKEIIPTWFKDKKYTKEEIMRIFGRKTWNV
jgi:hypothetical protein